MKTSELTGVALDAAVAKCEGIETYEQIGYGDDGGLLYFVDLHTDQEMSFRPSTDWAQGGSIIEREGITTAPHSTTNGVIREWKAGRDWPMSHSPYYFGTTPLIAAMRCYVASKLGDEVEIQGNQNENI